MTEAVEDLVRTVARAPSNPPDMEFVGKTRVAVGSGPAPGEQEVSA